LRLLGRRPAAERVRECRRAEHGHSGHDHEIPRSPAAKQLHECLQPSCALSREHTNRHLLGTSRNLIEFPQSCPVFARSQAPAASRTRHSGRGCGRGPVAADMRQRNGSRFRADVNAVDWASYALQGTKFLSTKTVPDALR
jgi:hypothetical protein